MKKLQQFLYKAYIKVINSIAFYPTIVALLFFLFSFFIMAIEYQPFVLKIKEVIGFVLVQGPENGRLILGTIVGSIFSLMVFSFSMVMLVLNRVSSTLSPRVIPGLITQKAHQVVLGFYLGTIIYSLILIINIQLPEANNQLPTLGILLSMMMAIGCLALFVYFIHSISLSIQVDNILDKIYEQTKKKLQNLDTEEEQKEFPNIEDWYAIKATKSGYLKQIQIDTLKDLCNEHEIEVAMTKEIGFFLIKGYPYLKVNMALSDDAMTAINSCFIFYIEERVSDHYLFGFRQINEIAVKALSPGINDPGTAVKAIDLLSSLFQIKMEIKEKLHAKGKKDNPFLWFNNPSLEQLLYDNFTPIREYGKHDATVMLNLLESLKNLIFSDRGERNYQDILYKYSLSIVKSCIAGIDNDLDRNEINKMIKIMNELLPESTQLPTLSLDKSEK